jgi:hypothetical protein
MKNLERKNFSNPDELRTPSKTRVEVVKVGDATIMRGTFEPGWKWSECVKPVVGTKSCEVPHVMYIESGSMIVKMDNGEETETKAGDAVVVPPGHDAWVVGDKPCITIDFSGGANYAKPS